MSNLKIAVLINNNIVIQDAIRDFARNNKFPINGCLDKLKRGSKYVVFCDNELNLSAGSYAESECKIVDLVTFMGHILTPITVTVKLNNEYSAEIQPDGTVKVGCQTFNFTAIETLYKKAKEIVDKR